MTIHRLAGIVFIATLAAMLATGCVWHGLNTFALPGTQGRGPGSFTIQAQLPDVDRLQPNSRVRVNDVTVGSVTRIERQDWHALVTIWACQAGKDVYVEKPCSHFWWEGRQMVRAAEKYNRVVQAGTTSKTLFPGVRLGWAVGPAEICAQLVNAKQTTDQCAGALGQRLFEEYVRRNLLASRRVFEAAAAAPARGRACG